MTFAIFTPADIPNNEVARNSAVKMSGLLEKIGDPQLTDLCQYTKSSFDVTWAAVAIIFEEWQYIIACSKAGTGIYRRSTAISSYVVADPSQVMVLLDATVNPKFEGNPFVSDGNIAFYAGAPILDHDGYALGALCITSPKARTHFSSYNANLLMTLAGNVQS